MYVDLVNGNTRFLRKYQWKLKVPLKIHIFMWFLNKKVLITRDNYFCDTQEMVNHLFISRPFFTLVWRVVYATYAIPPPTNIIIMFGNWINGINNKTKPQIHIGVSTLVWSIWSCRNNIVFHMNNSTIFINMAVHWIQLWRFLSQEDWRWWRDCMVARCNQVRMVAQDIFYRATWWHTNRLQNA
jgi:hypothetical protein